jgi:2',3'-cyclic-nucleotide 2'-phosphodiesterase
MNPRENAPSDSEIRILFLADIIGQSGLEAVRKHLPDLTSKHRVQLVIANGENAAHGKGLTPKSADALFEAGIHVITSGNHIWNQKIIMPSLDENPRILRPLNYPAGCPGHGSCTVEPESGLSVQVVSLQGRSFLYPIDCPFRAMDAEIVRCREKEVRILVVDFHAEATAEKSALGRYLAGQVSAVIGTHTHVQTADECILPGGTAFITDIGMCGPVDSVIGMDPETAILRFTTQIPVPYRTASNVSTCCGAVIHVEKDSGKAKSIERFQLR